MDYFYNNSVFRRNFRSSDSGFLTIPVTCLRSMGDWAFSSVAPKLWNSLPTEIRQAESLSIFKCSLKTYFFRLAYTGAGHIIRISSKS